MTNLPPPEIVMQALKAMCFELPPSGKPVTPRQMWYSWPAIREDYPSDDEIQPPEDISQEIMNLRAEIVSLRNEQRARKSPPAVIERASTVPLKRNSI